MKIQYCAQLALTVSGLCAVFDRGVKEMILAEPNFVLRYRIWKHNSALSLLSSAFIMKKKGDNMT